MRSGLSWADLIELTERILLHRACAQCRHEAVGAHSSDGGMASGRFPYFRHTICEQPIGPARRRRQINGKLEGGGWIVQALQRRPPGLSPGPAPTCHWPAGRRGEADRGGDR
jgi:hypothetical protein